MIEILVTVALLSVIILGLVAMFNQTRRAFTSSLSQVDVLEAGRSVADFIAREMEQMAPSGLANGQNFYADTSTTFIPVGWPRTDPSDRQTNNIERLYFLTRYNQQWTIVGYRMFTESSGIGTLYRFSISTNVSPTNVSTLMTNLNYFNTATTNIAGFTKLIDGVVDFRIRAYDTNGFQFFSSKTNAFASYGVFANQVFGDGSYLFTSNSLPAYVDVELGIVEDRTLAHYRALTNGTAGGPGTPAEPLALGYLTNHLSQVHMFRQHITIRNVNPAAL